MKTVAVLFAHRRSPYKDFDLADVYDEDRDALTYSGFLPVAVPDWYSLESKAA